MNAEMDQETEGFQQPFQASNAMQIDSLQTTKTEQDESSAAVANNGQSAEDQEETQPNGEGFFADTGNQNACSVRVALRVRPLIGKELKERSNICVEVREDENQIIIGKDRAFTFDRCFGLDSIQEDVYELCVKNLVLGCFQGFNATILAYGQTGSGKTHTMGSGYTIGVKDEELGIIPRVIRFIFDEIEKRKSKAEFIIKCSFLEIYNEELHDLLDSQVSSTTMLDRLMPQKKEINIREEKNGTISVYGLKEMNVKTFEEMAGCLDMGSSCRSTSATLMNQQSSRSHGIFTITIEQHLIEDLMGGDQTGTGASQAPQSATNPSTAAASSKPDEYMVAKFHFVDLAGSERPKKTGASGDTFKEGVAINMGLLALGNVISQLTEESKKQKHVAYRDSKLTRILQDSLGGNSRTVMIACTSPAESNFEETLNTLKYASRARNIKNKPIVNRDPASQQIAQLRQTVYELQKELLSSRKLLLTNNIQFDESVQLPPEEALAALGSQIAKASAAMGITSASAGAQGGSGPVGGASAGEIKRLEGKIQELKAQNAAKEKQNRGLSSEVQSLKDQLAQSQIAQFEASKERDMARYQLEQLVQVLRSKNGPVFEDCLRELNNGKLPDIEGLSGSAAQVDGKESNLGVSTILDSVFGNSGPTIMQEYQLKVEEQSKEISEAKLVLNKLQVDNEQLIEQARRDNQSLESKAVEIERLKGRNSNLMKESGELRQELRRAQQHANSSSISNVSNTNRRQSQAGGSTTATLPSRSSTYMRQNTARPMTSRQPAISKKDFGMDIEVDVKHFDEIRNKHIEDFTQMMSNLFVSQPVPDRQARATVKLPNTQGLDPQNGSDSTKLAGHPGPKADQEMATDDVVEGAGNEPSSVMALEDNDSSALSAEGVTTPTAAGESKEHLDQNSEVLSDNDLENDSDIEEQKVGGEDIVDQDHEALNDNNPQHQTTVLQQQTEQEKEVESQMIQQISEKEGVVQNLEVEVQDKQLLLNQIKQSQRELQDELLKEMQQQYHTKIQQMQEEMAKIESEKQESLKKVSGGSAAAQQKQKNLEEQFKKRSADLMSKVKELEQKQRQQVQLSKNLDKTKLKVNSLEGEINKMKTQRVTMMKKIKEESENFAKMKKLKTQEIAGMKKQLLKKQREMDALKRDAKKNQLLAKRKQEEIVAIHKRQKLDAQKKNQATKMRQKAKQIDTERIRQWILGNITQMVDYQFLQEEQVRRADQCHQIEEQIDDEQKQKAKLSVQCEKLVQIRSRLELAPDGDQDDQIFETDQQVEEIQSQMGTIQANIDSLEDKRVFFSQKVTDCNKAMIQIQPERVDSLVFEEIRSPEGYRAIISTFYNILLDAQLHIRQQASDLDEARSQLECRVRETEEIIASMEQQARQFELKIQSFQNEYNAKEQRLVQIILQRTGIDAETDLGLTGDSSEQDWSQVNLLTLIDILMKQIKNGTVLDIDGNSANQLMLTDHEKELLENSKSEGLKKAVNAKLEDRERKKENVNQTKASIAKENVELQRKQLEHEGAIRRLEKALSNAQGEKSRFKRLYEEEKRKKMQTSDDQQNSSLNQSSALSAINQTIGSSAGAGNNLAGGSAQNSSQGNMMQSYRDARNQRKLAKVGGGTGNSMSNSQQMFAPNSSSNQQNNSSTTPNNNSLLQEHHHQLQHRKSLGAHQNNVTTTADVEMDDGEVVQDSDQNQTQQSQQQPFEQAQLQQQANQQNNVFTRLQTRRIGSAIGGGKRMSLMGGRSPRSSAAQSITALDLHNQKSDDGGAGNTYQANPNHTTSSQTQNNTNWELVFDKPEAHQSQIFCLQSVGNQLYSSANRSLKIWDLETMRQVSDLQNKFGLVRALKFWPERNLLFMASEKTIAMWDVISLTNIGQIKSNKEEIKALHLVESQGLLFVAGRASSQSGGLLVFDIRKNQAPICEKEKNQDVFSLAGNGDYVFYGCRNHTVNPFCLKTFTQLQPLNPPHFDVVSSLTLLQNGQTLVSGSRDKVLRMYDAAPNQNPQFDQIAAVTKAHNDHINCLELDKTDPEASTMFSGSKDGIVKVWQTVQQGPYRDIQCTASLVGNDKNASINSICSIGNQMSQNASSFACGSSDKSIRIFRQKSVGGINSQNQPPHQQQVQLQDARANANRVDIQVKDPQFTSTQLQQLQELEFLGANNGQNNQTSSAAVLPDQEIVPHQQQFFQQDHHSLHSHQQQNATQQSVPPDTDAGGMLSQLRRRKQMKQQQQLQKQQQMSSQAEQSHNREERKP